MSEYLSEHTCEEINQFLEELSEGLPILPGPIERIPAKALWAFGVSDIDWRSENLGARELEIERIAEKSYGLEWDGSGAEPNMIIMAATTGSVLGDGNEELNQQVASMVVNSLIIRNQLDKTATSFYLCDVGAGTGWTTIAILNRLENLGRLGQKIADRCRFFLLEPSKGRGEIIEQTLARHILHADCTVVNAHDYEYLRREDLGDGTFDVVYANAVWHHKPFPHYLIDVNKKLADDGVLIIGDWFMPAYQDPTHLVPLYEGTFKLGYQKIRDLMVFFGITREDVQREWDSLSEAQKMANKVRRTYLLKLAEGMRTLQDPPVMHFIEALQTLEGLDEKRPGFLDDLRWAGFEPDLTTLKESHKIFARWHSRNIRKIFRGNEIKCAMAVGKARNGSIVVPPVKRALNKPIGHGGRNSRT